MRIADLVERQRQYVEADAANVDIMLAVGFSSALMLAKNDPEFAERLRHDLEADFALALGIPAEAVEAQFTELIVGLKKEG